MELGRFSLLTLLLTMALLTGCANSPAMIQKYYTADELARVPCSDLRFAATFYNDKLSDKDNRAIQEWNRRKAQQRELLTNSDSDDAADKVLSQLHNTGERPIYCD